MSGLRSTLRGPSSYVFHVDGAPVSQGSHRAFIAGGRAIVTDTKKGLKPWRAAVASAAAEARGDDPLLDGPVRVVARFIFPRPKAHFGTGGKSDVLKQNAPRHVTSHQKGDLDKHLRSIFDALTGVLFRDDAQVAEVHSSKVYGAYSRCSIEVSPLQDCPSDPPNRV